MNNIVLRLLRRFCPPAIFEEIEGDLLQRYHRDMNRFNSRKASMKLTFNTMKFFRPGILRRRKPTEPRGSMMLHYVRLSFRNMFRNKIYSLVNISGLAIALTAFFMITQYVSFELGFDRFHESHERLFRVVNEQVVNGKVVSSSAKTFIGMRDMIKQNFPGTEVTGFVEVPIDLGFTYGRNDKTHSVHGRFIQADTAFFSVFSGLLEKGVASQTLTKPRGIVLSNTIAQNTFGDENPVNQPLSDLTKLFDESALLPPSIEVTGVFKDLPADSHMHFDIVFAIDPSWDTLTNYWNVPEFHTYIKVSKGTDVAAMESRLNALLTNVAVEFPNVRGTHARLQAITDINLQPGIERESEPRTDPMLPFILAAVGMLIMLIAWINYVNLETARFVTQAKEVGIRRVIGSTRTELVFQFMTRYLCLNLIAIVLAVVLIILLFPYLHGVTGIPITQWTLNHENTWLFAAVYYVIGAIVAGTMPLLLSLRFNPTATIKGMPVAGWSARLRSSLVVVQYVASLSLIAFVFIAYEQVNFMMSADKKMDVEQVVVIENAFAYTSDFENNAEPFPALYNSLKSNAAIKEVSSSSNIPGRDINFTLVNEMKRNKTDPFDPTPFKLLFIDYHYIPMYGLNLKAGRNYLESEAIEDNTGRIILNEAAIHALGFKTADEAINQTIYFQLWPFMKPRIEIVGVLEDHHHRSIKDVVQPTIYFLNKGMHQLVYFSIRLNKNADTSEALSFIESTYKKQFPKNPFNYFFVDDLYQTQFASDLHFVHVFQLFSGVASFLACLGILGITLFETNTRLKEISIRKILGASAVGIVALLSRNQMKVLAISILVSAPFSSWLSSEWLASYPVRIGLNATPFVVAAACITLLTLVASGLQTIKAAQSNPVDHLKNE